VQHYLPMPKGDEVAIKHMKELASENRRCVNDNVVAETFLQLLTREKIRRQEHRTREAARRGVFEYVELFCGLKRKHTNNGVLSHLTSRSRRRDQNTQVSRVRMH